MKKILITGASGFVGCNTKQYLQKKKEEFLVYAPSSKELDCLDENAVKMYLENHHFDIILHFAVYGDGIDKSKDGSKILEYNLRMFLNFAKCSDLYGKMVYTGSGAEFDKRYPIVDVKEEEFGKRIPVDQYGLMKYTVNQIIEQSDNIYNLRLFGIFGPQEYWPAKFISNICCKTIKNLPLSIYRNVYFDYLWIDDFCEMLYRFLMIEKPKYHSYNAVHGEKIDLLSICNKLNEISGKNLPIYVCNPGLGNEYTASSQRIVNELGSFQYTDKTEAIRKLYHWYCEREDAIDISRLIYERR